VPDLTVTAEPQHYTCLEPRKRFRFVSLDSDYGRGLGKDCD
jgi:hypothetical protein